MSPVVYFRKCSLLLGFAAVFGLDHAGASPPRPELPPASHTVQPGDVLSVIAERTGVPLALLRQVNQVRGGDKIRPGQVLLLARTHEVKPGDVLGTIAEQYGVGLAVLYQHNGLTEKSVLKVGQRLVIPGVASEDRQTAKAESKTGNKAEAKSESKTEPKPDPEPEPKAEPDVEYYEHKVRSGEALSTIASRFSVPTNQLNKLNKLGKSSLIRIGQTLKIPVNEKNQALTQPEPPKSWHKYALKNSKRGQVTLTTFGRTWSGQAVDAKGNILPEARRRMHGLFSGRKDGKLVELAPRLLELLVQVSDEFGGRPIRVVSGYREHSYSKNSRHPVGRALDFSIPGVPNSAIVDYLLTLSDAGVGYYPNSTHVHMDVRSHRMYWVDMSGPGQPPRYVHKSTSGERIAAKASGKNSNASARSSALSSNKKLKTRRSASSKSDSTVARLDSPQS